MVLQEAFGKRDRLDRAQHVEDVSEGWGRVLLNHRWKTARSSAEGSGPPGQFQIGAGTFGMLRRQRKPVRDLTIT